MTQVAMFQNAPNCGYYIVTDPLTQQVVAVVEAGDEPEAQQFFAVLRHMLRAAPESEVRALQDTVPPNGVPVFRLAYLKFLVLRAQEEGSAPGTTRH